MGFRWLASERFVTPPPNSTLEYSLRQRNQSGRGREKQEGCSDLSVLCHSDNECPRGD